jgi:hypothetical protein
MKQYSVRILILLALWLSCCHREGIAQAPQKLRVLVIDCVNRTPERDPGLGYAVTRTIYEEFARSGKERFLVIDMHEVWTAAERLGLPVPEETAAGGHWSGDDMQRLAGALHADAILESEAATGLPKHRKLPGLGVILRLHHVVNHLPINGASAVIEAKPGDIAIKEVVVKAVSQILQDRPIVLAHVLKRVGKNVILDHGVRDGIRVGDRIIILREVASKIIKVGEVKVARSFSSDSECDVIQEIHDIQEGDVARVFYQPSFRLFGYVPWPKSIQ